MAIAVPLMMAIGGGVQAANQKNAADYNAKVMGVEATTSGMQANEATNTQLRQGNMVLGRSTAAAVESGGGIQGSTGAVLHQSATNAELDALDVRYAGLLRSTSYSTQASLDTSEGKQAAASALFSGAAGVLSSPYAQQNWFNNKNPNNAPMGSG